MHVWLGNKQKMEKQAVKKKTPKASVILVSAGCLLLAGALCLTLYNIVDEKRAEESVTELMTKLEEEIYSYFPENTAMPAAHNDMIGTVPEYKLNPQMKLPTVYIDGHYYVGYIEIKTLGIRLPIIGDWSYPNLKTAPCRYDGSPYTNDLIIAAHNYNSHFGRIKNLRYGDIIKFTDTNGNVFNYSVIEIDELGKYAVEEMKSGDFDLTLFTCTLGGRTRVTVRCELIGQ